MPALLLILLVSFAPSPATASACNESIVAAWMTYICEPSYTQCVGDIPNGWPQGCNPSDSALSCCRQLRHECEHDGYGAGGCELPPCSDH